MGKDDVLAQSGAVLGTVHLLTDRLWRVQLLASPSPIDPLVVFVVHVVVVARSGVYLLSSPVEREAALVVPCALPQASIRCWMKSDRQLGHHPHRR